MIYGNRSSALSEPKTIVISKRKADQYFPGEDPVGKTMILNNDNNKIYRIGGVMENFPTNSHLKYDFLISLSGLEFYPGEQTNWMTDNYHIYIVVHSGTNVSELEKKLSFITRKYYVPAFKQNANVYADKAEDIISYSLQSVHDIHLKSDKIEDNLSHGDIRMVRAFILIAGFILLIACINFINLSTAKVSDKAKEIGLRRTMGAKRITLVKHLLTEAVMYSFISFVSGLFLAWLFLPVFNSLSSKSLVLPFAEWWFIPVLLIAALIVGVLAGIYPSLYLSGFQPIHTLKKSFSLSDKKFKTRSALTVFQFASTIVLIIGTFVIYRQMSFILNKELGYDKEQVLLLHGTNTLGDKITVLKNELLKLPDVKNASVSGFIPVEGTQRVCWPWELPCLR
ncbi:MAG: ABC transporter permease [Mangrovibacterium sp.]